MAELPLFVTNAQTQTGSDIELWMLIYGAGNKDL
jgi:hypothetical protein